MRKRKIRGSLVVVGALSVFAFAFGVQTAFASTVGSVYKDPSATTMSYDGVIGLSIVDYSGLSQYAGDTLQLATEQSSGYLNSFYDATISATGSGVVDLPTDSGNGEQRYVQVGPTGAKVLDSSGTVLETIAVTSSAPPSAPSGLTATPSTTSVALSWSAVSGASSYTVLQGSTVVASGITGTTYTVSGLTPNTNYSFSVETVANGVSSPPSASATTTTLDAPPSTPTGLKASSVTGSSAVISWTAVPNTVSYTLYSASGSVIASGISGTSYTMGSLANGTAYSVQLTAVNSAGESAKSSVLSFTTLSVPSAPTGLSGSTTLDSASLTWIPVSGATSYNVYRDGVEIAHGGQSASYTDSGLTQDTSYSYTVTAVDSVGESAQSTALVLKTGSVNQPVGGLVLQGGKTRMQVQYTGNEGPFTITATPSGGSTPLTVTTADDAYVLSGLSANTDYTVSVTDAKGNTVSGTQNTGNVSKVFPPSLPNSTPVVQQMLDSFGTAGKRVVVIILAAVSLGVIVFLSFYVWRLFKRWLHRSK